MELFPLAGVAGALAGEGGDDLALPTPEAVTPSVLALGGGASAGAATEANGGADCVALLAADAPSLVGPLVVGGTVSACLFGGTIGA